MTAEKIARRDARVRLFFRIGVMSKGLVSLLEITGGLLAYFVPVSVVTEAITYVAQGELFDDPNSFIATHIASLAHQFSYTSGTFIAIYLLSRGFIKLFLVISLLRDKIWAYPSALAVLSVFVSYQLYEIWKTGSVPLIALTVFDLLVMWFIWREYRIVTHARLLV